METHTFLVSIPHRYGINKVIPVKVRLNISVSIPHRYGINVCDKIYIYDIEKEFQFLIGTE